MVDTALPRSCPESHDYPPKLFLDRHDAGRRLASGLRAFRGPDVVVLGIPTGGVAVAYEIAVALQVQLDVIVAHELRAQLHPESIFGAVGEDHIRVIDDYTSPTVILSKAEALDIERAGHDRVRLDAERFRRHRPHTSLQGRTVVIADDGAHTVATARAACLAAYARGAIRVILALPVVPRTTKSTLAYYADKIVCLESPHLPAPIREFYLRFDPLTDAGIHHLLDPVSREQISIIA